MNEELIRQIVRRMLDEPTFQALLHGKTAGFQEGSLVKPKGLVLLNYVPEFERVITSLRFDYGGDYILSVLPSDQAFVDKPMLPEGITWITPQEALSTTWQKIILPACSPNILAKAALGIRDNPLSEMVGRGITQGIPTLLGTEYLGFTDQTPKAYRELYEGYLEMVTSYGVMLCATIGDDCHPLSPYERRAATRDQAVPQKASLPEVMCYEKKYLADKDAYVIAEETVVIVKPGTIISPLARDTLKSRRIVLRQETEGTRL
ncbi:MAG TPA: flavoprotein [Desulfosporosinus sp.]|nr:flavoprotein [Desulfosporosinus sp.]